jgi:hypothetical protein
VFRVLKVVKVLKEFKESKVLLEHRVPQESRVL